MAKRRSRTHASKHYKKDITAVNGRSDKGRGRRPAQNRNLFARYKTELGLTSIFAAIVILVLLFLYLNPTPATEDGLEPGSGPGPEPKVTIGTDIGQQAPDFTLTDTEGTQFSLSSYRGAVVILDFMATWCGPCVTELDHLKDLQKKYGANTVRILSIDVDDRETSAQLAEFKSDHGCSWQFAPYGGQAGGTYGASSIPTLYIIDQKGIVQFKSAGVTSSSVLEAEIEKLV